MGQHIISSERLIAVLPPSLSPRFASIRYLYGYGTPLECDMAVLYYEMAANYAVEEIKRKKVGRPSAVLCRRLPYMCHA